MDQLDRNHDELFPLVFGYAEWIDSTSTFVPTYSLKRFYFDNQDISMENVEKLTQVRVISF